MITIPRHYLRAVAQDPDETEKLLEWVLSTSDIAYAMGTTPRTVTNWRNIGRGGVFLASRTFSTGNLRPVIGHRLQDVEMFAEAAGLEIDYEILPAHVQIKHKVGKHAPKSTVMIHE